MNNSKKVFELPKVDYSNLPDEIEGIISKQAYVIEKKVKLTWDNRQFLIRIPKEIAEEWKITPENQVLFRLMKPRPNSQDTPKLEIMLV